MLQSALPRILFCRANPISPDPRVEKEAHSLAKSGYAVSVIGWDRSASLPSPQEKDGYTIHRIPIRGEYASGIKNLPKLLRWQAALSFWLYQHRSGYDIIHACDFDTILPALWARKYLGKKVIYDIFDFYADHLRRTPVWIKNLIRKQDLRVIGQADAVIICDDARIQQIKGSNPKQVVIIYNSPEEPEGDVHIEEKTPQGSLNIAYIGLLQVERGLFEMLEVLMSHPEWHLDLAGFGGDQERIIELANKLPNVKWFGRIPYHQTIEISRKADVLFALYDPSILNHRYSSPNKVFEALMLGKPIIVANDTNMDRIIQSTGCGLVVPYGDVIALESALKTLASNPALRAEFGVHARTAYQTGYSWAIMEQRLLKLYQEISAK